MFIFVGFSMSRDFLARCSFMRPAVDNLPMNDGHEVDGSFQSEKFPPQ